MITQAKDFLNNVHRELESFITTQQGDKDDFPQSWYALDYEDVDGTIDAINSNKLEARPIVQVVEMQSPMEAKTKSNRHGEVQKISLNLSFYIIVTDKVQEGKKRKILLNKLASELKYKFDNYYSEIPHFRRVSLNLPDGILTRDSDGVYSCRLDLSAEIFKKVR